MSWTPAEIAFWASVCAIAYTYVVYPALLFVMAVARQSARDLLYLFRRRDRRSAAEDERWPTVALLVAAYNEENVIEAKLRNTLEVRYPTGRWELLLGLDAPTDSTQERAHAGSVPAMRIISFPARRGKAAVLNDLASATTADILVFSDANTMLARDCLCRLVRHFRNPQVGAVCGELRLVSPDGRQEMESLYWRYEVALKFLENRLNCVLGANGAVYAVRRSLFRPMANWIVEDFQLPMEIRFEGLRVVYDPEALATEEAAPSFDAEFRRKVRIGAGAYQTLLGNPRFLNPLRGLPAFAYFSHKVVRWLAPLCLAAAFISNAALLGHTMYAAIFAGQCVFYLMAAAGQLQERRGRRAGTFAAPLYFSAMNLALLLGAVRFISGRQSNVWTVTPRSKASVALLLPRGKVHD